MTLYIFFEIRRLLTSLRFLILLFSLWTLIGISVFSTTNTPSTNPLNVWDGVFRVIGDYHLTIFFIVPLFIYVIGDISLDRPLGDMLKIRVGSRNRWWVGKCAALSLFAFIYILILCLSTILISLIIYPWDTQWSDSDLINNLINSNAMLHYSPIQILLQAMLLLVWGCVGLGLFNMLISFVSGREIIGYIVLLCIIFISIAAYTIGLKSPYINFSLNPHIDINLHSFGNLKSKWPSFFESIIYWWVWIVFFIIFGLWVSGKRDLLTRMDQS